MKRYKLSHTAGGIVTGDTIPKHSLRGTRYVYSLQLLGIYPKETLLNPQGGPYEVIHHSTIVTIKSWRLPEHLLREDYLRKMCYMFTTVRNDEVDLQIAATMSSGTSKSRMRCMMQCHLWRF